MTSLFRSFRSLCVLLVAGFALATVQAADDDKIGPKLAKPMKAAQEAIVKKQWDQALTKIAEAEAVPTKSAFEQFQINEFKGYVLLQQKKYAEVAKIYEANLASGKQPTAEVSTRLKALTQLNTAIKNYPKVIEFGERLIKSGGADVASRVLVGQAYYVQKDHKNSIATMQGAVKAAEQGGGKADENWLQMLRSSQQSLGDTDGSSATLEKLVRLYPKPEYWDFLLSTRMRQKNSDRVQMNLLRVARQVGVLNTADEYVELAEMLLEAGMPGEARTVMEAGYQSKAFDTPDKAKADRYKRRMDDAKAKATKDQASLAAIEKEVTKAPTGQGAVALGLAQYSFGEYDKAAASLASGLAKGGVRDVDQAQLILGITQLKLNKKADALKAFEEVKVDPAMADVAQLWTIVARS